MKALLCVIFLAMIALEGCASGYQPASNRPNEGPWSIDTGDSAYYRAWQNEAGR
jgi:hypothetical protein